MSLAKMETALVGVINAFLDTPSRPKKGARNPEVK